jgi:hypothetical protein
MKTWFFLKAIGGYIGVTLMIVLGVAFVCLAVHLVYLGLHWLLSLIPAMTVVDNDGVTGADVLAFIASPFVTLGLFIAGICAGDEAEKEFKAYVDNLKRKEK